jgi:hypothetical protein
MLSLKFFLKLQPYTATTKAKPKIKTAALNRTCINSG